MAETQNNFEEVAISVNNITKGFKIFFDRGYSLKDQTIFKKRRKYEFHEVLKGISFQVDRGEAIGLIGRNGCGKSTTLNALLDLDLETGTISRKIARGKNTTRHTELIEKNGIRVMDTAGFNLLEAENALDPGELKNRYPEFAPYEGKCRFRECLHDREPGCAVTAAAEKGEISSGRLERYRELLAEAKTVWRDRYD